MNDKHCIRPKIGEIYLMYFDGHGNEQSGFRPGLVFQNNTGNEYSPNIVALPLTSSLKKKDLPTHVIVRANDVIGLNRDSMILCENPAPISKRYIGSYIATLPNEYMRQVAEAHLLASSALSFLDFDTLINTWKAAKRLNCSTKAKS